MSEERDSRTAMLIGEESVEKLKKSRVAVFGLGGVGGYVVEALARAGIGTLDLVDGDTFAESNLNRQILATTETIGRKKAEVARERVQAIRPDTKVNCYDTFFLKEEAGHFPWKEYDYIVDAIDTVSGKIALVEEAKAAGVPVICAMGAGNKLCATGFEVADISKTSVCPLAKVMRRELKERGIKNVKVVYSKETPCDVGGRTPGSISYVPAVMGLILAGEVIKDLAGCAKT